MKKKRKWLRGIFLFFCLLSAGGAYLLCDDAGSDGVMKSAAGFSSADTFSATFSEPQASSETALICVYITGAVVSPGVYELSDGARVYELIAMAGGFTGDADMLSVNQAALLHDEEQVTVYVKADGTEPGAGERPAVGTDTRIDINTADRTLLMSLPGIGETKAEAIIAYREKNGRFASIEEIMNVTGIGESMFAELKNRIRV